MKKLLTLFLIVMVGMPGFPQREHFVFINHQDKQPFYVRMGEQIFSSSLVGHLSIAPLTDSVYAMYVGFPRSRAPELLFDVRVASADKGLLLSNQGGDWQLVDQLTGEVIKPMNTSRLSGDAPLRRRDDSYSMLMADVVDDSSVLYSVDTTRYPRGDQGAGSLANRSASADVPAKEAVAPGQPKLPSAGREGAKDTPSANNSRLEGGADSAAKAGLAVVKDEPGDKTEKAGAAKDSIFYEVTTVGETDSAKSGERSAENVVRNSATDTTVANSSKDAGAVDTAGKKEMGAVKEEPGKTVDNIIAAKDSIIYEVATVSESDSARDRALENADRERAGAGLEGKGEVKKDSLIRRPGDPVELSRLAEQQQYQTRAVRERKAPEETAVDSITATYKERDLASKDQKTPLPEATKPDTNEGSRKDRKSRRQRREAGPDDAAKVNTTGDSSRVIRLEEVESREGRVLLYLDRSKGSTDTIRLIIPRL